MIDLMKLSNADLESYIRTQSIIARQDADAAKIRDLRAYYAGDHPVHLTQRQQEIIGPLVTESDFVLAHNLVRTVLDTLSERLTVTGFTVDGVGIEDERNEDAVRIWDWWTENRLDAQQIRVHRRALRDGWSYAMVDYDEGEQRPRVTVHKRDDGTSGIMVNRSTADPNVILWVTRYFWTDTEVPGRARKTVYLPHEIRKYIRADGGAWVEYQDPGDESWPIPWVDRRGEPLGIPIIEFQNPSGSEIEGIIGLQNALNKGWYDLVSIFDYAAFPLLIIENDTPGGFSMPKDDDDLQGSDEFHLGPGRAIEVYNAKVHRIASADMRPAITGLNAIQEAIASVSRTPLHYLRPIGNSDFPSGEALKQLESGLVMRAQERHVLFGHSWADLMRMCAKVEDTLGKPFELKGKKVRALWADPEVRNEIAESQVAQLHSQLGVPQDAVWENLGYDPVQIAAFHESTLQQRAVDIASIAQAVNLNRTHDQSGVELPSNSGGNLNGNGSAA